MSRGPFHENHNIDFSQTANSWRQTELLRQLLGTKARNTSFCPIVCSLSPKKLKAEVHTRISSIDYISLEYMHGLYT
jgi:hypothetical protein